MEQLNNLPAEFIKPIYPCLHLLQNCEIQIFNKHRTSKRFTWNSLLVFASVIVYHSSLSVNLISLFKGKIKLVELSYIISVYVVCTQSILKTSIVALNKKRIRLIIQQLGAIWTTKSLTEVQINKKNVLLKRLKFCYTVFYWMNIIGSWQYMLAPLLETLIRKYILQQDCELLLPFACSFPFNPTGNWWIYIGVYIFEIYSMFRIVFCYLGTEFLMITLCSHLATEFAILNEDLNNIEPGTSSDFEKLRTVIATHQKLIYLAKQLDKAFNKMIFVNLLSTNITICFFGFSAKVAKGVIDMANNFTAVLALILPLFNLCYYSELLRESSASIGNSAYDHSWYHGSIRYQKMMWFIIRRSQKPCSLTSLKYNPIALHTFTTVLSTTWSYFSLASSLYEGEG